jgi:glycosyltransferase involved in cell wall biosynthesis
MRVNVVIEQRFHMTPDGAVWTDGQFAYSFWSRYLAMFDQVQVIARVRQVASVSSDWKQADGDRVVFASVPYYVGPVEYLRKALAVRRAVRKAVGHRDAVVLRVSSTLGSVLHPTLRRNRRPYAVEVVADPYDVFSPGSVRHPLRPIFRWWFTRELRRQCAQACGAAYVTAQALQRRYPPGETTFATHYSSVELPAAALVAQHRADFTTNGHPRKLITVGSLAHLHKAPDVLLDATARCVQGGTDLRLVFVGDGKHRKALQSRAAARGLIGRVDFLGQLSGAEAVRTALDQADVFVLPSRHEGLPRAMIEAMARGLPCIGSTAGGIPELLPAEDLVPTGDVESLAAKIREVVSDPPRMIRMSTRNTEKAKEYREDVLRGRRTEFYRCLREKTEEWLTVNSRDLASQTTRFAVSRICL